MVILRFPPIELADESGLLAVGGDLEPESLLLAYRTGIFPWPSDETLITWFAPRRRALLRFEHLHLSRTVLKELKRSAFRITLNRDFPAVIERCAEVVNRGNQHGTWITDEVRAAYCRLSELGYAYSIEAWLADELVGGMYGVTIGRMVAGESMFYRESGASRAALLAFAAYLARSGVTWFDCQVLTPHMEQFGAREVPQIEFSRLLDGAVHQPALDLSPRELTVPRSREDFGSVFVPR